MTLRGKSPDERHEDHLRRMAPGSMQGTSKVGSPGQGKRGRGNTVSVPPPGQDHGHGHTELSGVTADDHHGQVHSDADHDEAKASDPHDDAAHTRDYDADFVNESGDTMSGTLAFTGVSEIIESTRVERIWIRDVSLGGMAALALEVNDGTLNNRLQAYLRRDTGEFHVLGGIDVDGTAFFDQWLVAVGIIEARQSLQAYDHVYAGSNGSGTGEAVADKFNQRSSGLVNDLGETACSNIHPVTDRATGSSVGESSIRYLDAYIYNGVTSGSDPADKTDVVSLSGEDASDRVRRVAQEAAIGFRWLDGTRRHLGFDAVTVGEIHGDVSGAYVDSAVSDPDGESRKGLRAHELIPDLYAALNAQIDRADALEQRVAELERVVSDLSRRVG